MKRQSGLNYVIDGTVYNNHEFVPETNLATTSEVTFLFL